MDLAYDRRGTGEPLLLLHGIGHHRQGWSPVLDLLAAHRDVIAVDLPGHGESPELPGDRHEMADLVTAVVDFCAGMGVERPHVAGNSLGGLLALELADRGMAASATALSPAGFHSRGEIGYAAVGLLISRALARHSPASLTGMAARFAPARTALFGLFYGKLDRHDPAELAADAAAMGATGRAFGEILRRAGAYSFTGLPQVPVTIGWGTRDRLLLPVQATRAHRRLPNARVYLLDGLGHVPMGDDPERVAALILHGSARS